ncbi:hypothetical protein EI94DRAFT_1036323 [Lactarius quietus]|nr:hypothetical protein EI94DRAFT_1036323 [Lactarius quietus]
MLGDLCLIVEFIARHTGFHESQRAQASECLLQRGRRAGFPACTELSTGARNEGREETYEVVLLYQRHNVQRLEMRKARGELGEELFRYRRFDDESCCIMQQSWNVGCVSRLP